MDEWFLEMSMIGPHGEHWTMRVKLDPTTAREGHCISKPVPGLTPFDEAVVILKRREYRKDLFIKEAQRLGTLLAERMEDAEGWHGIKRQEPAKQELSQSTNYRRPKR